MMLLGYLGTPGATVTYSIDNADKTEHTAETGTGVVTLKVGTLNTLYGVVVADPPIGGVVHWYEGGAYITSEIIAQPEAASQVSVDALVDGVTLAADQPLYAPAKPADVQVTVPEPVFAGTVTFSGTVEAPAVTVNPTLTPEESAKLMGAAQEATLEAVKLRTDTLDAATGTLTLSFRLLLDSDGDGIADDPPVGVGGVRCHLLAHGTHTRIRESATTDSQGYVYWHGLAAGTYDVDPDAAGYEGVTVAVTIPE